MVSESSIVVVFSLVLGQAAPTASADGTREWKDDTGRHTTEAQLVELSEQTVRLLTRNGNIIDVPFKRLSSGDQAFVVKETGGWPMALENNQVLLFPLGTEVAFEDAKMYIWVAVWLEVGNAFRKGAKFVTLQPSEVVLVDYGVLCYDLRAWRHARRY